MTTPTALRTMLESNTMAAAPELVRTEAEGIRCFACGHRCLVKEGKAGICRVRMNAGGTLMVPAGYVAGLQVDPIEKKPFFHAFPGRDALSFGMLGCDFHCGYCQNWVTSQALRDEKAIAYPHYLDADAIVRTAIEQDAPVVVSTYNEPLITSEWAVEVFTRAREKGLACGFVSNGNGTPEVLKFLRPWVDLYKVDLKSFNDKNYRKLGGVLKNVLDTIVRLKEMDFWVELVTLIIPGFNNDPNELREMAKFIAGVSADIPWHITAFHPDYKMTDPPRTGVLDLEAAYDIGKEAGLHFVYPGNLPGQVGHRENTFCKSCGTLMIHRRGFRVLENRMVDGGCPSCGELLPGVWEDRAPRTSVGTCIPRALRV
jgi:pyruvate formate lyase activating enzyme